MRFRAIATEACRRADNQRAFVERVRSETGLYIDVIPAEEEARLAVAGCAPLVDPNAEQLLVFDIGGGSTELIWVDLSKSTPAKRKALLMALAHGASRSDRARAAAQHVTDWISLPVGVVTLGEMFDRIIDDGEKFKAMYEHTVSLIEPFADQRCAPTAGALGETAGPGNVRHDHDARRRAFGARTLFAPRRRRALGGDGGGRSGHRAALQHERL